MEEYYDFYLSGFTYFTVNSNSVFSSIAGEFICYSIGTLLIEDSTFTLSNWSILHGTSLGTATLTSVTSDSCFNQLIYLEANEIYIDNLNISYANYYPKYLNVEDPYLMGLVFLKALTVHLTNSIFTDNQNYN